MSLIVEDGSIVVGANSYVSVADADAYFAARNNTDWDDLDASDQKIPYLIAAVDFMQQAYRMRWYGLRYRVTQVLDWPRLWVPQFDSPGNYGPFPYYYPPTLVPQEIKDAQCRLTLKCINGDLAPDVERVERMIKVGAIQVEYDRNRPVVTVFRDIELLLKPFFKSAGVMTTVVR